MSIPVVAVTDLTQARQGARKVLADCLDLKPGNRLSVYHDEMTQEPARLLIEESKKLGLNVADYFVPVKHQLALDPEIGLCERCRSGLYDVAAIITCLNDSTQTTPYRRELLRRGPTGTTKVGHIPGASLFVLASAINVDYAHSVARCEDLAFALALGDRVKLITYLMGDEDKVVSTHELNFNVGGLRRMPVVSNGVIPSGTWGNLPGGETFIAPLEDSAEGEIAINGAYKDRVLKPGEALILTFQSSRLSTPPRGPVDLVAGFNRLLSDARTRGDHDFNALAEFGIGVNLGIHQLTGHSLFDEKCAGTIHIALGDSSGFGGKYHSNIHEDLISRLPSVYIDGKIILEHGEDRFREEDWYEDLDTFPIESRLEAPVARVVRSAERTIVKDGVVRVKHEVSAGRVCTYRIGRRSQCALLGKLYLDLHVLSPVRAADFVTKTSDKHHLRTDQVLRGLSILLRHRLLSII